MSEQKWYVADRRIKTKSARLSAAKISQQISTGSGFEHKPDDQMLFSALHTCAYWATPRPSKNPIDSHERAKWVKRWNIIREYIVENNMGLVYTMIGFHNSNRRDGDDLLSDAMFGLFNAIDHFNPWKGYRFSTYACTAIGRLLRRQGRREINYRRVFSVQNDGSLEGPADMPDSSSDQTGLFVDRLNRALDNNLANLTELESKILALRFPPDSEQIQTFLEISKSVGMSKERVRQIQNVALKKLRNVLLQDPILND